MLQVKPMRMALFLWIVSAFLCTVDCYGQQGPANRYDSLLSEGRQAIRDQDYRKAYAGYEQAMAIKALPFADMYNAACAAARIGMPDKALELLLARLRMDTGWYSKSFVVQDTDLTSLHADRRWNVLVDSLSVREAKYESQFDQVLRAKLKQLYEADQPIRHAYVNARKNGAPQQQLDSLLSVMGKLDTVNQATMDSLMTRHGWISSKLVGNMVFVQFLVMQHAPLELRLKHERVIRQGLDCGDLSPAQFALYEDRTAIFSGKKQRYGTQITYPEGGGTPYVDPCEHPEQVNALRASIGLPPMSEYLKSMGLSITWDY